jgi:hypothetical protein
MLHRGDRPVRVGLPPLFVAGWSPVQLLWQPGLATASVLSTRDFWVDPEGGRPANFVSCEAAASLYAKRHWGDALCDPMAGGFLVFHGRSAASVPVPFAVAMRIGAEEMMTNLAADALIMDRGWDELTIWASDDKLAVLEIAPRGDCWHVRFCLDCCGWIDRTTGSCMACGAVVDHFESHVGMPSYLGPRALHAAVASRRRQPMPFTHAELVAKRDASRLADIAAVFFARLQQKAAELAASLGDDERTTAALLGMLPRLEPPPDAAARLAADGDHAPLRRRGIVLIPDEDPNED